MKYLLETAPQTLEIRDEVPPELQDGHAKVRVAYVGVCHSDTAKVAQGRGPFPSRMGHEVSGTVIESKVKHLPPGTRVVAYVADGYADELVAPAASLVPLHPDCSMLDAALAEPLACVIGGIEMLDLTGQREVVLVGSGFMGLMALRVLVANGHRVVVIEPRAGARALAVRWGADRVLHPDEVPESMHLANSVVIEATGGAPGLQLASDLVQIAGTRGIMGYHQSQGGKRTVDMESWNYRELRVLSLHHRDRNKVLRWIDRAQRMSANKIVAPSELVDRIVTLEELPASFAGAAAYDSIKTVLQIEGESS